MQRTTITLDDALAGEVDAYLRDTGGHSRSEAIRDLLRQALRARHAGPQEAGCVGVMSYVVDQSVRNLAARVPQSRLDRHDQTVASMSVPLDHSTMVDVVVMRGRVVDVQSYAEALFVERGVMHGTLGLIPVVEDAVEHVHNEGPPHSHSHIKVQSGF
ncbi:nickel-responsive transcriptional regulator NikR [Aquimixticola soesokkakensis]|nr:nickel-responsive transcriptional regulator NikR [Aquimixticola soesokkakensis]